MTRCKLGKTSQGVRSVKNTVYPFFFSYFLSFFFFFACQAISRDHFLSLCEFNDKLVCILSNTSETFGTSVYILRGRVYMYVFIILYTGTNRVDNAV